MKKVGRAKWWALVSDLNSNAAENGNKKATSLRYQPLYHAFLPYILPFLLCHSPFFLSFSLASSPFLFRQFCTRNLFSGRTLCSIHNTTKWQLSLVICSFFAAFRNGNFHDGDTKAAVFTAKLTLCIPCCTTLRLSYSFSHIIRKEKN